MTDKTWQNNYFNEIIRHLCDDELLDNMVKAKKAILRVRKNGGKIIFAGNGTSSLIATRGAMGFLTQLGMKCHSINDSAFITAAANDFGYDDMFERYINLYAEKKDVVILISASGKSKNILNALRRAKLNKCTTITFSGFDYNNPLKSGGDINFWTSCSEYSKVESIHNTWIAAICDFILKDEKHKVGIHGIEF